MDHNDGGGADNSSEAYADVVAIFEARESCIARGYDVGTTCAAYGDTCLTCTGLREMDWDARAAHTPATPSGYLTTYCGGGGGPCGKQVHCESYVPSEAMYDLAARDLPAMGIDTDSAWQLAERLWYQSRAGSGGDIYNCTLPSSDSCGVGNWYHQLRLQDDDDGNLANGTPHAAAIFAAFDRHDIACGTAGDAENQNTSSCPALDMPVVGFTAQSNAVVLDWDAVSGAAAYRVYRNENGCHRAQFPVAETDGATTTYTDTGLANGWPVFYRVQAIGANPACESPVSACFEAAAQQLAGRPRFSQPRYGCAHEITVEVTDLNHPSSTMTVAVWSDTEPTPEAVVLNETSVGSARFTGSIFTTTTAAAADGALSVTDGDAITAEYIDLDDGEGGVNVSQQAVGTGRLPGSGISFDRRQQHHGRRRDDRLDHVGVDHRTARVGAHTGAGQRDPEQHPELDSRGRDRAVRPRATGVYFRVTSTDTVGYTSIGDAGGVPFEFNASTIGGIFYQDGFETDLGWTLQGEWEIGVPQGLGTAPGDPAAATEGVQVLGQDLSGQGSNPGDYEFNTTHSATSPVIDTSSLTDVELRFDRWLITTAAAVPPSMPRTLTVRGKTSGPVRAA